MIHETFYRLDEEKRRRLILAARKEFLAYPFEKSSINRILEDAEIPKGSFYQYFDGKEDLFYAVIESIAAKLMELQRKHHQSLLDFGINRTEQLGYEEGTQQYMTDVKHYLSQDDLDLYQRLIDAPPMIRNYLTMELMVKLAAPEVEKELREDKTIRKNLDYEYAAYLLSMSEMLCIDYAVRHGMDSIGMLRLSYEYMNPLMESFRRK
ncbi:MAG: TetR/AcrR family transcriptional regulator [Bulleidia sp.]|nr:TetR/AcrR family transcriptional regulator [Bulleidia sp.]